MVTWDQKPYDTRFQVCLQNQSTSALNEEEILLLVSKGFRRFSEILMAETDFQAKRLEIARNDFVELDAECFDEFQQKRERDLGKSAEKLENRPGWELKNQRDEKEIEKLDCKVKHSIGACFDFLQYLYYAVAVTAGGT